MSLYANINKRKKAGTSRSKKDSTISPEAYADMEAGFPKGQKGMRLNKYNKDKKGVEEYKRGGKTAAWTRKEGKSPSGGLNKKGRDSYKRENPGSKLKAPVTGKVKKGSKAAKRRKSFCARMRGMKGPMKDSKGRPTRKALALRKWKCRLNKKKK